MKTKKIFLCFLIFSGSLIAVSQNSEQNPGLPFYKHQIGLQFNPYLNSNETFDAMVYGIRYGYRISKPIILGSEISGSFPAFNDLYPNSNFKAGLFARYSFFTEKRINLFMETLPFYSYSYIRGTENYPADVEENKFGLYVAPGLSLYSKNRKFSIDLYYKLYIHPANFYYQENVISYKVNFHF